MSTISSKTFTLSDGKKIPAVGLGTWQSSSEDAYNAVATALQNGYRHIDTAWIYGNEKEVGKAIKDSGIPREEIFITTKLWNTHQDDVAKAVDTSLQNLGVDYIDLYLMHWPIAFNPDANSTFPKIEKNGKLVADIVGGREKYLETWKKMEEVFTTTKKLRSIGVSNFDVNKLSKLLTVAKVKPVADQVESHPLLPQFELLEFAKKHDIQIEAYSPLGSTGTSVLKNETIISLAKKYDVSPATIVLSWQVSRGVVVLPKSVHKERIIDNLKTITLKDEDIKAIDDISKTTTERVCDPIKFWNYDLFGTEEYV
ncbi:hypothetical protein PACTADRAFT_31742 [Pachysolen tannophilus NRRL Y-2460]|uniref:2-dehydropantolactone reductase n=2 Tax=Pachysolen tannophilus TaxID=4918 RepID=A0A1E4U2W2_PACTA